MTSLPEIEPSTLETRTGSVHAGVVSSLLDVAGEKRSELKALLVQHEVSLQTIADPRARLPIQVVASLWDEMRKAFPHQPIAILAASNPKAGTYGSLEYLIRNRPDVRQALKTFCQYYRLVNDTVRWGFAENEEGSGRVTYAFPADPFEYSRIGSESVFAWIVSVGRKRTGVHWLPERVSFQHLPEGDQAFYLEFFGCPVQFGAPKSELVLSQATLDLPFVSSDPALAAILDQHAQDDLRQAPTSIDFVSRVFERIERALSRGQALTLVDCAADLRCSTRVLQRELARASTTYSTLLDRARREACAAYLIEGKKNVSEIAFSLGFSEPSAFVRAFRRWHGVTPKTYQKLSLAAETAAP